MSQFSGREQLLVALPRLNRHEEGNVFQLATPNLKKRRSVQEQRAGPVMALGLCPSNP
jgi:hypothetical protein